MYLTGYQTNLLGRLMTTLAEPHEERDIRKRVGEMMLVLLGAQHYASYVWDEEQKRFDSGVRINMDAANIARYERYYQFHDPITFKLQQHRKAVRVTDVMPQNLLLKTEFFNDFLKVDGLYWGVNLYAWKDNHNIGDMRIWRDKRRANFTNDDLELLNLVQTAFVAALHRTRQEKMASDTRNDAGRLGHESCLTLRESEIVRLVGMGLSDKEISCRLGISVTTVRTHFEHMFRKMNVNNRTALVHKLNLL